jgi:uncharacterized protein YicC (UPF0701 family)
MRSMTGFAAQALTLGADTQRIEVDWDMRAVNGKGLDLRLRLPESLGFLEKSIRDLAAAHVARGSVTLSLKLRAVQAGAAPPLDPQALDLLLHRLGFRAQAVATGAVQARAEPVPQAGPPVRAPGLGD